jgi:hypothetical protein
MANWIITIEVAGKKLDTALSLAHALKPISLESRPVANSAPGRGQTKYARIVAVIESANRPWTVKEVAERLGEPAKTVGIALANLTNNKRVKRVGTGKYKAVNHG